MRNHVRSATLAAALVAVSAAGQAADQPVLKAPAAAPAPAADWTGLYFGIHGGYGWGDADFAFPPFGGFSSLFGPASESGAFSQRLRGGIFGGHLGYSRQFGNLVLGLESSFAWSGVHGSSVDPLLSTASFIFPNSTYESKVDWYATLTPRLGLADRNWHAYVKGGLAAGRVRTDLVNTFAGPAFTRTFQGRNDHVGWTVGAGIEYAWAPNWVFGIEYNYVNLGGQRNGGLVLLGSLPTILPGQFDHEPAFSTVLARLSYRQSPPGAPAVIGKAPPSAAPHSWSGFYAGVHGGYGWGDADYSFRPLAVFAGGGIGDFLAPNGIGGKFGQSVEGGLAGIHLGYNYAIGGALIGLEGSFAWSGMEGSSTDVFVPLVAAGAKYDSRLSRLATITPRLAFASGNWLGYVKGGLAAGSVKSTLTAANFVPVPGQFFPRVYRETNHHIGWTVGAGVEYAWMPGWTVGIEFNHVDLGSERYGGISYVTPTIVALGDYRLDLSFSTVIARLSRQF